MTGPTPRSICKHIGVHGLLIVFLLRHKVRGGREVGMYLWGAEKRSCEYDQTAWHESIKELIKTLKDLRCFDNSPHPPSLVPGWRKSKVTPVVQDRGWTMPWPRVCKQHLYRNPCEHVACTNSPSCSAGFTTQFSYLSCGLAAYQCAEENATVSCWGLSVPCLATKQTSSHFGHWFGYLWILLWFLKLYV